MITGLVYLAIYILVLCVVIALLLYIVRTAPWGDEHIKGIARWVLIVLGALIACLLLLNFIGVADVGVPFRR